MRPFLLPLHHPTVRGTAPELIETVTLHGEDCRTCRCLAFEVSWRKAHWEDLRPDQKTTLVWSEDWHHVAGLLPRGDWSGEIVK